MSEAIAVPNLRIVAVLIVSEKSLARDIHTDLESSTLILYKVAYDFENKTKERGAMECQYM